MSSINVSLVGCFLKDFVGIDKFGRKWTNGKSEATKDETGAKTIPRQILNVQNYMTLEEIAKAMNCTRERVRQIESKALRKLRIKLRQKGYDLPQDILPD